MSIQENTQSAEGSGEILGISDDAKEVRKVKKV